MLVTIAVVIGVAVLAIVTLGTAFFLGMRAKSRLVRGVMIWFTRTIMNPMQMKSAGTPGAYAAVIRARGRVSGRLYETPIGAVVSGDDFVIALPYGTQANWVRNVLAAGSATLAHEDNPRGSVPSIAQRGGDACDPAGARAGLTLGRDQPGTQPTSQAQGGWSLSTRLYHALDNAV
jgi:hypothetical protein